MFSPKLLTDPLVSSVIHVEHIKPACTSSAVTSSGAGILPRHIRECASTEIVSYALSKV